MGRTGAATPRRAALRVREAGRGRLGNLAQLLSCPFDWDDLVVPAAVRDVLEDIVYEAHHRVAFWERADTRRLFPQGQGLMALFSGPPGTGKTMAAQVVASTLGYDLFRVDLAGVVSKWVGETSQNFERILTRAADMHAIILFDECALALIAPSASKNVYLVKGPVRGERVSFAAGGGGSYLEVEGTDTSVAMDYETRAAVWADVTDSDAVSTIVGRYGYTPDVEDTRPGHFERKHALVQRDTDFGFVRTLARRNGCLFWISADAEAPNVWGYGGPCRGPPSNYLTRSAGALRIARVRLPASTGLTR